MECHLTTWNGEYVCSMLSQNATYQSKHKLAVEYNVPNTCILLTYLYRTSGTSKSRLKQQTLPLFTGQLIVCRKQLQNFTKHMKIILLNIKIITIIWNHDEKCIKKLPRKRNFSYVCWKYENCCLTILLFEKMLFENIFCAISV